MSSDNAGSALPQASDPLIGASLDGYVIEDKIGSGGMGVVYRARDLTLKRSVAVKTLFIAAANDEMRRRFEREATVSAGISHPNLVPVFDFGRAEGHLYLVMELIDGPDLAELIQAAPLGRDRAVALFRGMSRGLQKVHSHGLVHRDIKPSNVLIRDLGTAEERAMITDFGIARVLEGQTGLTFGPIGTLEYMAPEATGMEPATDLSDQYCLALVLYEMLAQEHLFVGQTMPTAHREEPVPDLKQRLPDVPSSLRAALRRALDKDPAKRFASVEAFAEAAVREEAPGERVPLDELMAQVLADEYPKGLPLEALIERINAQPENEGVKAAQVNGRAELYPQLFRRRANGHIALRHPPSESSPR